MRTVLSILVTLAIWETSLICQGTNASKNSRQVIITFTDSVVYTYISLQKKENIKISNTKTYYWFNASEIHSNKGGYSGTVLNGPYEVFNTNGNLIRKGTMKDGLLDGIWNYWNSKGQIIKTEEWNDGILEEMYSYNSRGMQVSNPYIRKKAEKEEDIKLKSDEKTKQEALKKTLKETKENDASLKQLEKEKKKNETDLKQKSKTQEKFQSDNPQVPNQAESDNNFTKKWKNFTAKLGRISFKKNKTQSSEQTND